jgi:hypothetical protein
MRRLLCLALLSCLASSAYAQEADSPFRKAYHRCSFEYHFSLPTPPGKPAAQLGGLAVVPGWRKSSAISMPWPQLREFSAKSDWLDFELAALTYRSQNLHQDWLRGGRVYVAILPKLVDAFREAERMAKALSPATAKECQLIRRTEQG